MLLRVLSNICQRFREYSGSLREMVPISVGIFLPKVAVSFLTNRSFVLIREFGKGIKSGKSHSYWLALFNPKMSFRFPPVFPPISDQSVWHNGKHPTLPDFIPGRTRYESVNYGISNY